MSEDPVSCDFQALPLVLPTRSPNFFIFFHYLSMSRTHDHKILPPGFQKIVMVSNFGDIFGSRISSTGAQKNFSLKKWAFLIKATLYLKMKKI